MFDVVFLGTGAMKPMPRRFTSSLMIRHKGKIVMFDAGEGIQVRVSQSGFSPMKVDSIFITHFHGDHFYGLPGMIFTMAKAKRIKPLTIYGPLRTREFVHQIMTLGYGHVPFEVRVEELQHGSVVKGEGYAITAFEVDHGPPALGYVFKEDGGFNVDSEKMKKMGLKPNPKFRLLKQGQEIEIDGRTLKPRDWLVPVEGDSLAYTGDTRYNERCVEAVKGVTVLVHESTYASGDVKEDRGHSSAKEAAEVAKKAGVKNLFLIHLSPKYLDTTPLLDEARAVFPNTNIPNDLDTLTVKKGGIYK